jgi:alginate O-acetyltransferase complex protein AlgI
MLFTEPLFFLFFVVVFCIHWWLRGHRSRKVWLMLASYVFYGCWDWRFLFLILASTLIDHRIALWMAPTEGARRKRWLTLSLCTNLGLLGFFKYFNFFTESANSLLALFGDVELRTYSIILPVGISFYTFQTMSYSIDAYRRKLEPIRDFWDFALFVSFFPQLVMGPILRAKTFLPQLERATPFRDVAFAPLLTLFVIGFIKKACISDNIAPMVDSVYAEPGSFDALGIWIAVLFYTVQIYCDFSGYTDMAIAVAGMLGYRVALNFDWPLLTRNVSEFYRRWHISFSSWLRDYLYFPLGGSQHGERRTARNLMITMLLSGLWHGAGGHYIVWGGLNGAALVGHRWYRSSAGIPAAVRRVIATLAWPLNVCWFAFTLIFFRADNIATALGVSRAFALGDTDGRSSLDAELLLWLLPLALAHVVARRLNLPELAGKLPAPAFAMAYGIVAGLALSCVQLAYRPFIYFQF